MHLPLVRIEASLDAACDPCGFGVDLGQSAAVRARGVAIAACVPDVEVGVRQIEHRAVGEGNLVKVPDGELAGQDQALKGGGG